MQNQLPDKRILVRSSQLLFVIHNTKRVSIIAHKQALGFQIPWKTIFRFHAQRTWEPICNFFGSVNFHGNPFLILVMETLK